MRIGVLADDLSGGMNIGTEFAGASLPTLLVERSANLIDVAPHIQVLIINTDTRYLPAQQAHAVNHEAARLLRDWVPDIVVKKIDSLLRGSIGNEVDAIAQAFGFDRCLLIAASPKIRRQTIDGYQLIDGVQLNRIQQQLDPSSTVQQTHVPSLLAQQSRQEIIHISSAEIREPDETLQQTLAQANPGLIVADSSEQHELNRVVAAAHQSGVRFFAGTYGMGEAISCLRPAVRGPVLVAAGSLSAAALRQVAVLNLQSDCMLIAVPYDQSFFERSVEEFGRQTLNTLSEALARGSSVILQLSSADASQIWKWGRARGYDASAVSARIDALLRYLLQPVLPHCRGFIATGGSTAHNLFGLLDAAGLRIGLRELLPGTPEAYIYGGAFDGLPFVIKPGSQGEDDALLRLFEFVRYA
jgi:D-threonate/D-erythronate kinase